MLGSSDVRRRFAAIALAFAAGSTAANDGPVTVGGANGFVPYEKPSSTPTSPPEVPDRGTVTISPGRTVDAGRGTVDVVIGGDAEDLADPFKLLHDPRINTQARVGTQQQNIGFMYVSARSTVVPA